MAQDKLPLGFISNRVKCFNMEWCRWRCGVAIYFTLTQRAWSLHADPADSSVRKWGAFKHHACFLWSIFNLVSAPSHPLLGAWVGRNTENVLWSWNTSQHNRGWGVEGVIRVKTCTGALTANLNAKGTQTSITSHPLTRHFDCVGMF